MKSLLLTFALCCSSVVTRAEDSSIKTIKFENQKEENFTLENFIRKTFYQDKEIDSTCTRDKEVQENFCRNETRYKQECRDIPAHQECHTEYDRRCETETRYEEECHYGPSRQDCRQTPPRQDCWNEPDRQDCHEGPSRQECRQTPSRQECHDGPSRQECSDGPSRQECKVVVRYREECTGGGRGERQCRTIPGDIICHKQPNGENRCEKIPPRQECSEGPSTPRTCRQVPYEERECRSVPGERQCRTVPGERQCRTIPGENVCRTVPGERQCRTIPGERQCRTIPGEYKCDTIPGERICRQVPRQEEVCRNVPRQACDWIPTRNVCENVPYQEQVCKLETVTKKEEYACKKTIKVPYTKVVKTHRANVMLEFLQTDFSPKMEFSTGLSSNGELLFTAKNNGNPKHIAILESKDVKNQDSEELNTIDANFKVKFISIENELTATPDGISNVELQKKELKFLVNGKFPLARTILNLKIAKKGEVKFEGTLKPGQFKINQVGDETEVNINLSAQGAPNLGGIFNRKHQVTIELVIDYRNLGNVLTGNTEKVFRISKSLETSVE